MTNGNTVLRLQNKYSYALTPGVVNRWQIGGEVSGTGEPTGSFVVDCMGTAPTTSPGNIQWQIIFFSFPKMKGIEDKNINRFY